MGGILVFLSIAAAVSQVIAYIIYLTQVYSGTSVPNPASWTIWVFLATLNAFSFWKASGDALATTQFFTGSGMCMAVFGYSLYANRFSRISESEIVVLVFCLVVCIVWYATRSATYANLIVGGIFLYSAYPTIDGVWRNSSVEQPLPWWIWTTAFTITSVNVFRRTDRTKPRWWFLMVVPVIGIIIHGAVALGARR